MNKERITQYCCAVLVAVGIGLNVQNAIADCGIAENSLSLVAGPGSSSGSNTNFNSNFIFLSQSDYNRDALEPGLFDKKQCFWFCSTFHRRECR